MVMDNLPLLLVWCMALFTSLGFFQQLNGQSFSLLMHHKFSEEVKTWMNQKHGMDRDDWPVEGSKHYYKALYHHDNVRHGRSLVDYQSLTFWGGNETAKFSRLGFLYYTLLQVGTPNVTLLVALDTGSDLFWVPCDCQQCAPPPQDMDELHLQNYSPSASQTSKTVTCNSDLCDLKQTCSNSSDQCPYKISYVSANTSSSGNLVEDILYLTPGDGMSSGRLVKAPITFGCGTRQTGSFLEGAAPDGLLGLGIEAISVPSILSQKGFVQNSFSMCFPRNGSASVGRFTFGDQGSSDQKQTSFIIDQRHPTYYVGVKEFYVGGKLVTSEFQALFDTGTSFTYLADPAYKDLTSNFHLKTNDTPLTLEDNPFEYCYQISNNQNISKAPEISLILNGGNSFPIIQPLVFLGDPNTGKLVGYCLAVMQSTRMTIIGQNFMSGYQLVFDRKQLKLGWKEANCYDVEFSSSPESSPMTSPLQSPGPLAPSTVSASPQTSYGHNSSSSGSSTRPSISPAALPANPIHNDAVHLRSSFLCIVAAFLVSATILDLSSMQ